MISEFLENLYFYTDSLDEYIAALEDAQRRVAEALEKARLDKKNEESP